MKLWERANSSGLRICLLPQDVRGSRHPEAEYPGAEVPDTTCMWVGGAGNFFNTDLISKDLKNFITLWPIWGFYRGWGEYKEYANQVMRLLVIIIVLIIDMTASLST